MAKNAKSVLRLPGEKEAEAIARDYQVAVSGIVAWVKVGLRMIDVKDRVGKGNFTKWVEENLVQRAALASVPHVALSRRHLFRAKAVAEHLLKEHGIARDKVLMLCEDETHVLWEDVIGKSTRQLSLEVKEAKLSQSEKEAKAWCENAWKNELLRDQYEPRVLSGELSYVGAKAAMIGLEHGTDEEGKRPDTNYQELMRRNFAGAARHFKYYEELPVEAKESVHEAALEFAKSCPPALADMIRNNLPNLQNG